MLLSVEVDVAGLRSGDPAAGSFPPSLAALMVVPISEAATCLLAPDSRPSTSSPLDEDYELEEVDVAEEGAAGVVI